MTPKQRTAVRYVISINMSIIFGLFLAGLINSQLSYFFGYLPLSVFVFSALLGLAIAAIYASLLGQISFNVWAILAGWLVGAVSALMLGRIEIVPYSLAVPLIAAVAVTTILTFIIQPKPFAGLDRLVMIIHAASIFIVLWDMIYSVWVPWLRPLGFVFALDTLALWSPSVAGGCPLTFLENDVRVVLGQQTELSGEGFIRHYLKAWFGIRVSHMGSYYAPRALAVVLFSVWAVEYIIAK